MSIQGILHVKSGKKGPTFTVTYTNAKDKEIDMSVQESTYRFDPAKAVEGDAVVLELNTTGQIDSCTIPGKEAAPLVQEPKQTAKHGSHMPYSSGKVQNAGGTTSFKPAAKPLTDATAPYNFIPYVHQAVLPPFENAATERWSGTIHCTLKALTPLLVSGPQKKTDDGKSTAPRSFLRVNGQAVIPGSSLKGMIRSLLEVQSFSYMRPMNDSPLFWRLVNRPAYRERFPAKEHILGGYLRKHGAEYTLEPVAVEAVPLGKGAPAGKERVETGPIKGKKHDYMFTMPSGQGNPVSREVVHNFLLQQSPYQQKIWKKDLLQANGDGHPVFYLTDECGRIVEIGLARYFRLQYKHRPADLTAYEDKADFCTQLFGTVKGQSRKGRVAFESAAVQGTEEGPYSTVLGQPSPTCLAHYVVQNLSQVRLYKNSSGNDPETFTTYNDELSNLQLRGRKWYWHRDKDVPPPPSDNEKVCTTLKPYAPEATATFAIRVDNVTSLELGALLEALDLPEGHAHKLGLGKSLGFGSVRISLKSVDVHPTASAYTSLVARCKGLHPEALSPEVQHNLREDFKRAVTAEVQKRCTEWKNLDYEALPPIKALRTMMNYQQRPDNKKTAPLSLEGFKAKAILLPVEELTKQWQRN